MEDRKNLMDFIGNTYKIFNSINTFLSKHLKLTIKFILSPIIVRICNYIDKMNKREEVISE